MTFNTTFCFLPVIGSGFCQTWEQFFRLPSVAWPRHGIQNVHGPHFHRQKPPRFNLRWSHDELADEDRLRYLRRVLRQFGVAGHWEDCLEA